MQSTPATILRAASSGVSTRVATPTSPRLRHVWINGRLAPAGRALLCVSDRGFGVGDGVFETIRVVGGHALELASHAERLRASADALEIPLPEELEAILGRSIRALLEADGLLEPDTQVAVRVTVSRGVIEDRSLLPPGDVRPTVVVQAWRVMPVSATILERGLHLTISSVRRDPGSPLATIKTTSRADFVFARLEARRRGADDALFLTTDGYLAEATSASLFLVEPRKIATPSLQCGILAGTTREWTIRWAQRVGLECREALLTPDELFAAEEVFLASSVAGVVPVTQVDGRPIGKGRPGPWTCRAREDRETYAQQVV